jgi:exodeoxyribonuclease-3
VRIATWNVNGIRAREAQVLSWIEQDAPDVICLQEIKAGASQVPVSLQEVPGYWSYWHGSKGYSGVALLVSKSLCSVAPVFNHPAFDLENRIVTALVGEITVASVYVPNGGKDFPCKMRFLEALEQYAAGFAATQDALVLCGDINVARAEIDVHPKERKAVIGQLPQERTQFERILGRGLTDVARTLDPENDALYTWWAPWRQMRERNIGWRLDYVLASPSLAKSAQSCVTRRETGTSDHAPVIAEFAVTIPRTCAGTA